jgi:hypothetical protein
MRSAEALPKPAAELGVAGTRAAVGGVVGFLFAVVALHVAQPAMDPATQAVSYYVHGSGGWLLSAGLVAIGVASLALAAGLAGAVRGASGRAGRVLLAVWGLGAVVGGVFPADPPGRWDLPMSVPGLIHGHAALVALLALPVSALCVSHSFRGDERWRVAGTLLWSLACSAAVALALFMASLVPVLLRPGPPVFLGLTERLLLLVDSLWLLGLGAAMLADRARP